MQLRKRCLILLFCIYYGSVSAISVFATGLEITESEDDLEKLQSIDSELEQGSIPISEDQIYDERNYAQDGNLDFKEVSDGELSEYTDIKIIENDKEISIPVEENEILPIVVNEQRSVRLYEKSGIWMQAKDGRWWYKHNDGSYTVNGWEYIKGKWYYFDASGWMKTGWIQLKGKWYYLNSDGAMQTGWIQLKGKWYYLNSDGVMQTGWIQSKGKWYYLNSDGAMQTGWKQVKEKWYYLNSDGAMQTGWQKIKYPGYNKEQAYWNYFDSSGAYITDSDVKGCSHGMSTFSDHKCISTKKFLYYITNSASDYKSEINRGAELWNNQNDCNVSYKTGEKQLTSHIYVTAGGSIFEKYTIAITLYFYSGNTADPQNSNWSGCQIVVNDDYKSVTATTFAHEFGHAAGLSHRIADKNSIMCQIANGRTAGKPSQKDIKNVNHLY